MSSDGGPSASGVDPADLPASEPIATSTRTALAEPTSDPAATELHGVLDEPTGDVDDDVSAEQAHRVRAAVEWIAVILGAIGVALLLKIFLFQAFYIPSASMEPTLQIDDRVLVNKLSYSAHEVHRGDLIVFERPQEIAGETKDLIKRVIGLEGETVATDPDTGRVLIDGQILIEPYLDPSIRTSGLETPIVIPEDHVLVMGDNRGNSQDGRVFGPIDEDTIVGRAFLRVWPLDTIDFL